MPQGGTIKRSSYTLMVTMLKASIKTLKPSLVAQSQSTERTRGSTWVKKRKQVLGADPSCVMCAADGIVAPAHEVDHTVPLWAGGSDALHNLQGLCRHHHKLKTAKEAALRASGSPVFD